MINPVLKKELKTRMRTWKTPTIISLYALFIAGLLMLIFLETFVSSNYYNGFRPSSLKSLYLVIIIFQMSLILFIVPATTSSSISGERERQTLDLLVGTRLSSFSIILGKLMASLAQIVLLIVVSIPVLSIMFLFGGFSIGNLLIIFAFYIIMAIFFGSIGVFLSTFFKRTTTSTIMSYFVTLILTLGTLIGTIIWRSFYFVRIYRSMITRPPVFFPKIMYLNPLSGLSAILEDQMGVNFFEGLLYRGPNASVLSTFYINIAVCLVISFVLLYLSSLKINPMKKFGSRRQKKAKENIETPN